MVPSGSLVDKTLTDAVLGFEGTLQNGEVNGQINGQALLDSVPIKLSSAVALLEKERSFGAIDFSAGATQHHGRPGPGRFRPGSIKASSSLPRPISRQPPPFCCCKASGSLNADVVLTAEAVPAERDDLGAIDGSCVVDTTRIGQATGPGQLSPISSACRWSNGTAKASDVSVAGIEIAG